MSVKIFKALAIILSVMIVCLSLTVAAYAAAQQMFQGTVTIDDKPAPKGASVVVNMGGVQVAQTTTDASGRYGYSTPFTVTGAAGDVLEFYVNGAKARETGILEDGKTTTLNLTVVSSSPRPSTSPAATDFVVLNLNLRPESVRPGEPVIVTAEVKNRGSSEGSYKINLKVNDVTEALQTVTLGAGKSQKVMYSIIKERPATYTININGQMHSFSVSASKQSWIDSLPWWLYVIIAVVAVLIIFSVIVFIQRRRSGFY